MELQASNVTNGFDLHHNIELWILKVKRDLDLWPHTWRWPWIFMVKFWNSCIPEWEGRLTLHKGGGSRSFMTMTMTIWWPRSGLWIYQIVTRVTSVVGVPSTHLVKNVILPTEYHFSLQLIFVLILTCSLFSNDISWIHFPEHQTGANYDLVSKETGSWVALPWLVTWPNSVLLIGWGQKFHQHHDRMHGYTLSMVVSGVGGVSGQYQLLVWVVNMNSRWVKVVWLDNIYSWCL